MLLRSLYLLFTHVTNSVFLICVWEGKKTYIIYYYASSVCHFVCKN